jgi:hypothetical protein
MTDEAMTTDPVEEAKPVEKKTRKKKEKTVKGSDINAMTKTREILQEEDHIQVRIPSTEKDKNPVFVGINGHAYHIKRDEWVSVPKSIVGVLDDAITPQVRTINDGKDIQVETHMVSRFSHSTKS